MSEKAPSSTPAEVAEQERIKKLNRSRRGVIGFQRSRGRGEKNARGEWLFNDLEGEADIITRARREMERDLTARENATNVDQASQSRKEKLVVKTEPWKGIQEPQFRLLVGKTIEDLTSVDGTPPSTEAVETELKRLFSDHRDLTKREHNVVEDFLLPSNQESELVGDIGQPAPRTYSKEEADTTLEEEEIPWADAMAELERAKQNPDTPVTPEERDASWNELNSQLETLEQRARQIMTDLRQGVINPENAREEMRTLWIEYDNFNDRMNATPAPGDIALMFKFVDHRRNAKNRLNELGADIERGLNPQEANEDHQRQSAISDTETPEGRERLQVKAEPWKGIQEPQFRLLVGKTIEDLTSEDGTPPTAEAIETELKRLFSDHRDLTEREREVVEDFLLPSDTEVTQPSQGHEPARDTEQVSNQEFEAREPLGDNLTHKDRKESLEKQRKEEGTQKKQRGIFQAIDEAGEKVTEELNQLEAKSGRTPEEMGRLVELRHQEQVLQAARHYQGDVQQLQNALQEFSNDEGAKKILSDAITLLENLPTLEETDIHTNVTTGSQTTGEGNTDEVKVEKNPSPDREKTSGPEASPDEATFIGPPPPPGTEEPPGPPQDQTSGSTPARQVPNEEFAALLQQKRETTTTTPPNPGEEDFIGPPPPPETSAETPSLPEIPQEYYDRLATDPQARQILFRFLYPTTEATAPTLEQFQVPEAMRDASAVFLQQREAYLIACQAELAADRGARRVGSLDVHETSFAASRARAAMEDQYRAAFAALKHRAIEQHFQEGAQRTPLSLEEYLARFMVQGVINVDEDLERAKRMQATEGVERGWIRRSWERYQRIPQGWRLTASVGIAAAGAAGLGIATGAALLGTAGYVGYRAAKALGMGVLGAALQQRFGRIWTHKYERERAQALTDQQERTRDQMLGEALTVGIEGLEAQEQQERFARLLRMVDQDAQNLRQRNEEISVREGKTRKRSAIAIALAMGLGGFATEAFAGVDSAIKSTVLGAGTGVSPGGVGGTTGAPPAGPKAPSGFDPTVITKESNNSVWRAVYRQLEGRVKADSAKFPGVDVNNPTTFKQYLNRETLKLLQQNSYNGKPIIGTDGSEWRVRTPGTRVILDTNGKTIKIEAPTGQKGGVPFMYEEKPPVPKSKVASGTGPLQPVEVRGVGKYGNVQLPETLAEEVRTGRNSLLAAQPNMEGSVARTAGEAVSQNTPSTPETTVFAALNGLKNTEYARIENMRLRDFLNNTPTELSAGGTFRLPGTSGLLASDEARKYVDLAKQIRASKPPLLTQGQTMRVFLGGKAA